MSKPNNMADQLSALSVRERTVALKSAEGLTYREIADELYISPHTVRTHLSTIYRKLGIRSKAALIHLVNNAHPDSQVDAVLKAQGAWLPPCPYPGMVPFQADDSAYFFGRNEEIALTLECLANSNRVMLIGPSGSGKSSLLYAGLLPRINQHASTESELWDICPIRPGPDPNNILEKALNSTVESKIRLFASKQNSASRVLLLVDQFEECFTQVDLEQREMFFSSLNLLRATGKCTVLISMRADFYPDLMMSSLWPVNSNERVEIAPLRGVALRHSIEKPAAAMKVKLEPALVEQLIKDAANEPGALPLLQETLSQLWLNMKGRELTHHAYTQFGVLHSNSDKTFNGLAIAIAKKADDTLISLSEDRKLMARRIFLRLIQFGEGRADTRRQQSLSELYSVGDDMDAFEGTLEHLTDHRLLTRSGDDSDRESQVDIAHESLIDTWGQLQEWLEERRESEQVRRRLVNKAEEWVRLGKGDGGLLDHAELPEAQRWLRSSDASELGITKLLPEIVRASELALERAEEEKEAARQLELRQAAAITEEQERRIRIQTISASRMRKAVAGLAFLFTLALGAALLAWNQSDKARNHASQEALARKEAEAREIEAEQRRAEAVKARMESIAQLLSEQAKQLQATELDEKGALLARQAYNFSKGSKPSLRALIDSVMRSVAGKPNFAQILTQVHTSAVAFSSDGAMMASTHTTPEEIILWDLSAQGIPPTVLEGYPGGSNEFVFALGFSADDKTLVAANPNGRIGMWNLSEPETPMVDMERLPGGAWKLDFSPDGRWLAIGSKQNNSFTIWDQSEPGSEPVTVFHPNHQAALNGPEVEIVGGVPVAFSNDSQFLATGSLDGTIQIWKISDWTKPVRSLMGHKGRLLSLVFYDAGKSLASSGEDSTIRLWNFDDDSAVPRIIDSGPSPSNSIDVSSKYVAASSLGGGIRLWELSDLTAPPTIISSPGRYYDASFSPDGSFLAAAGNTTDYLRLLNLKSSGRPKILEGHIDGVLSLSMNPKMSILASGGSVTDNTIRFWNWSDLDKPPLTVRDPGGDVSSMEFSQDGARLLTSHWNTNTIKLWNIEGSVSELSSYVVPDSFRPWTAKFNRNEETFIAAGAGGVYIWDLQNTDSYPNPFIPVDGWANEIDFNDQMDRLLISNFTNKIHIKELDNPKDPSIELPGHDEYGTWSATYSPDGKWFATGGRDGTVRLWDNQKLNKSSIVLGSHDEAVFRVRFHPDSKQVATSSIDRTVRLWNVDSPSDLPIVLAGHEGPVMSMTYSPDGNFLITSGVAPRADIRVWDLSHPLNSLSMDQVADYICQMVLSNLSIEDWNKFVGSEIPYEQTCPNLPSHPSAMN